ncbi:MAG: tRNA (adenosine(37)-N6)-threonylcarbamoyltransferase complex ATPase subunit type 1 TsaE [Emcibacter sp.]|nr:tRNA (adenosine(37)-N6)-threonylcarbamoyltransferase complex ATPase subunit type 1 TsaE [Emcibacter sp.]
MMTQEMQKPETSPKKSPEIFAELILDDMAAVTDFAARFAPLLIVGDIVALDGGLGAGKTALCRAIIQALGYKGDVPSPTFNLVQIYDPSPKSLRENPNVPTIWHMDLYRLEHPEEAFELGIEDAFDTAVSLIEWPSKLGPHLPTGFLTLRLEICAITNQNNTENNTARKLSFIGDMAWRERLKTDFKEDFLS